MYEFQVDATSKSILVMLRSNNSSPVGQGKTGLVYNTAGLKCYYTRGASGTPTAITLATQTSGGAYSSGGFVEKDATNAPGLYRLDVPNAALATGVNIVTLNFTGGGILDECILIKLYPDDPFSAAPTTTDLADALLKRDLTAVTGAAAKSLLNWMKSGGLPVERVGISGGVATTYDNDGTTPIMTHNLTGTTSLTNVDRA
jgi:hypothetical protein